MTAVLEVSDVSKAYGKTAILRGVSFSIQPGGACVIVGPSGAGKSTLLRLAAKLEAPDEGRVAMGMMEGSDTSTRPWPALTVVFQQLFLWPHLTLRANIALPAQRRGWSTASLEPLAARLDLGHLLERYPNQVSVGQRQRAAVARALLLEPRALLLDEITSSLDAEQIERMLEVLTEYLARGGAIAAISHQLGFARTLLRQPPSTFLFLDGGEGVESGGATAFDAPRTDRFAAFRRSMQRASWGEP